MTTFQRFISIAALLALAACGGGGGDKGTSPFGPNDPGGPGTPPGTPTAADISLVLSAPTVSNSGTETITATVTAVDANRNTVAGIPVTISVDNGASVQVSGTTTSTAGVVTGTVRIGADRTDRTITVTALSGAVTRQAAVRVVGTRITATALPAVLAPADPGRVQYRVVDVNGNGLGEVPITVTGPGGVTTTATTTINGDYEYSYTAPSAAGNLDIVASAGGVQNTTTVVVQSGPSTIPAVPAGSVRSATVRATPSVVPVNAVGSQTNRAEVRALFVGNNNAPVPNVRVRFDLAGDANSIGGEFSTGSTLVYSDANGVAQSAYIAGQRFSPTDGLTIRACWGNSDAEANACTNQATTTLTVISDALSVSIGTDELVVLGDLTYTKRFVVQVNDSSGLAKPDVQISPLLDLPSYAKGFYLYDGSLWVQNVRTAGCGNEDVNRNGVVEVYSNGGIEDANGNGQLDPRKADVVVSFDGPSRTNAAGQVILRVTYPRNYGSWVQFRLDVAAGGVSGTEGRASFNGTLPVPFTALQAQSSPAFVVSPYGQAVSGFTTVTTPQGVSASLCTNPN
ncbi:MAG: Ig-like domain-containing protein [Rubrivivax sp.]|nr:Ig-like domain-containing protein [Rubrivivax sp.]